MKTKSTLLYIITASILSTGCSSKKCVGEEAHKGLYNALTCNYDENIHSLKSTLNAKTIKRNRLFHNYQRLIAQTTNKQENINKLEQEILAIDHSIRSTEQLFHQIKQSKANALTVMKFKSKLKQLNMNILNKSTFFDIDDALFTNKKLISSSDKQVYAQAYNNNSLKDKKYAQAYNKDLLEDKKYAQAYNKDLLKDKKYAQAYSKDPNKTFAIAYKKDIEHDKKLRLTLSAQIEKISNSLNSTNFSSSEQNIQSLMEQIKNYNNSLKKS